MPRKLLIALSLVVLVAGGIYLYAQHRATQVVDQQFEKLVTSNIYDSAEYESLELGMTGDMHLTNVRVSKNDLDVVLQQVNITNLDYDHETPWHLALEIEGMQFPNGLPNAATLTDSPLAALFDEIVQDDNTIPVTVRYAYDYDADNSHQLKFNTSTKLPDHFTLTMDGETRNVPLDTIVAMNNGSIPPEQTMATAMQIMDTLALPQAKVVLQDHGVVESLLASTSAQQGATPDALREQWKSQARNFYLFLPQNAQGIGMQAGIQLAAFLDGGRTLNVAVTPDFEGKVSELQQQVMGAVLTGDFKKIADMLHLEIQTQ